MPFGRSRATSCDVQPRCVCLKGLSQGFVSSLLFGFFCRSHDFVFHLCSLSWWRASLPSSLGSMGRTKDRASKMSQESSNDALLEVIAQLRQQNQVLLDRLASQQSVNESVMAQARHTPATISDAPPVHPAADSTCVDSEGPSAPHTCHEVNCLNGSSCRRLCLENQESQLRETPPRKLSSRMDGLFPLFIHSRNSGWPTRVFVLPREVRQKRRCASCELGNWTCYSHRQSRSKLRRKRSSSKSKTSQGLSTMWKRYLVQLGDVPVTYKCSAPRGGAVEADTSLVVIGFQQKVLPSRCVEDSHDPTEVSYRILAQEAWSGARGLLTTQIRRDRWCRSGGQGSERQLREGSSRKRGVRCLRSPLLCQRRRSRAQDCPTPGRIRPPGGSEEGEGGRSFHPRGCLAGNGFRIAHEGVRLRVCQLARSSQRRNPGGLSGKDGRPQIYLCRGAKLRCRHFSAG